MEKETIEKLEQFKRSIGKKFTVGAGNIRLECTIEYVKGEMIGSEYGDFNVSVCELGPLVTAAPKI